MRRAALLFLCASLFTLGGCAAAEDGAATDDSNEINEARGSLEREIDPPITVPESPFIGAKLADVLAKAKGTATALPPKKVSDDCKRIDFRDPATKKIVAEHEQCARSEVVRTLAADGTAAEEHFDLNKDGKVDRYASTSGTVVTYGDGNYDGKIDLLIERVDRLKDFSMKGYEETYPKSKFLHRVREDRNHDGKFDHERLTAKGTLPAKSPAAAPKSDEE